MSGELSKTTSLDAVLALQNRLLALPQIDCPITHHFADGQYGREMHMRAGELVIGKMHRCSTLNVLLEGEIGIGMPGQVPELMQAPRVFVSEPNCKKVIVAITDVRFMTLHPTKLRDVVAIEQKFIVPEQLALTGEGQ
jgi:hypothetical protein